MGYAKMGQTAQGIHQRLYARAFLVKTDRTTDPSLCFVSVDACMGSDLIYLRVKDEVDDICAAVAISGTHTHSAPGGYLQYALYQGIVREMVDAMVNGIVKAIRSAHADLKPSQLRIAKGRLLDANINRSPTSYLLNPTWERAKYELDGDTDKTMVQLTFHETTDGIADPRPFGLFNWFAVHGTSMNSTNRLVSGDNKGYASYLMEKHWNSPNVTSKFVAGFCSTNLGDVSPNTKGPHCLDTGLPCDLHTSTCEGDATKCIAFGPGNSMKESTEIIGRRQYDHAMQLLELSHPVSSGPIDFRHVFLDMTKLEVTLQNGANVTTCTAALGYSFAGGTTDGPGAFFFEQGSNTSNPFWNMAGGFLSTPTKQQQACHEPKPIFLNTGEAKLPYAWDPNVIPISVFRISNVFILNVPSELTTMAGRRLRETVRRVVQDVVLEPEIIIAGLSNSYTHYVTTEEEYAAQRYEGASTIYGPNTLLAYQQEFARITHDLLSNRPSTSVEPPKDLMKHQVELLPPVAFDAIAFGKVFGSIAVDAKDSYLLNESVVVSFRSSNPRNSKNGRSFLTVEKMDENTGGFEVVADDNDWATEYLWKNEYAMSWAELRWDIPPETPRGLYRICHHGVRKTFLGYATASISLLPLWSANVYSVLTHFFHLLAISWRPVRRFASSIGWSQYRDFSGCSRTFLVH